MKKLRECAFPGCEELELEKHKNCYCRYHNNLQKRSYTYGVPMALLVDLLQAQNCNICGDCLDNDSDKYVDHDHNLGFIRGILCLKCNTGLGLFRDNTTYLYIEAAKACLQDEIEECYINDKHEPVSVMYDEKTSNERMKNIGQNGNTGQHYTQTDTANYMYDKLSDYP